MNDLRKYIDLMEASGGQTVYVLMSDETGVGFGDADAADLIRCIGVYTTEAAAQKAARRAIKSSLEEYIKPNLDNEGNFLGSIGIEWHYSDLVKHYQDSVFTITAMSVDNMNPPT